MGAVRILIADDHELVRKGMISIMSVAHPDWEIAGEASTGEVAIQIGIAERPDVAILDLSMPGAGGLDAAEQLLAEVPGIRILILTVHAAAPILRQLRRIGVHGYMVKNEAPAKLLEAVERMLAGEPFFASASTARLRVAAPEYIPVQFLLTPREVQVLRMLACGKSNKELATELDMSVRTAESHHANILTKLEVESLADLVRLAVRDRIV
ncbi:MAG: response regulator transcription factor [Acidobacteriota bacterium]|nr:response regulator transcription factor [Acidobacteriota bacterium]